MKWKNTRSSGKTLGVAPLQVAVAIRVSERGQDARSTLERNTRERNEI